VEWAGGRGLACILDHRGHLGWGLLYPSPLLIVAVCSYLRCFHGVRGARRAC